MVHNTIFPEGAMPSYKKLLDAIGNTSLVSTRLHYLKVIYGSNEGGRHAPLREYPANNRQYTTGSPEQAGAGRR
jgi:hypothetical protein